MIITIAIDTEDDKDGIDTLVRFVQSMESKKYEEGLGKPKAAVCASIMETARRRSAGENVVYQEDAPAPKKRGRKPKAREEA